jgi:hypothetical protein
MPLSALTSTTASSKKAGFAKLVDASATMGADLTSSQGARREKKLAAAVVQLPTRRRFSFNLAYDGLVFNFQRPAGLLFVWHTVWGTCNAVQKRVKVKGPRSPYPHPLKAPVTSKVLGHWNWNWN